MKIIFCDKCKKELPADGSGIFLALIKRYDCCHFRDESKPRVEVEVDLCLRCTEELHAYMKDFIDEVEKNQRAAQNPGKN